MSDLTLIQVGFQLQEQAAAPLDNFSLPYVLSLYFSGLYGPDTGSDLAIGLYLFRMLCLWTIVASH